MKYAINGIDIPDTHGPYSQGTTAGRLVFASGQVALDPDDSSRVIDAGIAEQTERTIFCSPRIVGTMTMAQLRSSDVRITNGETIPEVGLRKMVMVRVRTLEYNNEQQVIYRGEEMEVIAVTEVGENSDLLIRRKLGND